ncbi:MAG: hypothetical protein OXU36_06055 [Candidatus Poribacteria bacterium]|nr:hypothetical protein [Candidatus Poribacteria bacterium]
MNTDIKLQKCTTPFRDYLLKDLAELKFAKGYLEAAIQDFNKDGNIEILLLSIKNVAEAQGGRPCQMDKSQTTNSHLSPRF